jgi:diguanylate cyclase (GGDEF)-like protein
LNFFTKIIGAPSYSAKDADPALSKVINMGLFEFYFKGGASYFLITLINSVIIYLLYLIIYPTTALHIWFFCNNAFLAFRYVAFMRSQNRWADQGDESKLYSLRTLYVVNIFFAGLLFGLSGIMLFDSRHEQLNMFLLLIIAGNVGGASAIFSLLKRGYFAFTLPLLIPIFMKMLLEGSHYYMYISGVVVIYYCVMTLIMFRNHKILITSLHLRQQNSDLVTYLQNEKNRVERLNEQLTDMNAALREMSLKDPLTGLRNRRYLFDILEPEARQFAVTKDLQIKGLNKRRILPDCTIGIFLLDIDYFKKINDKYGHDAGDVILCEISALLAHVVRAEDIVVRWGGEEFIVILKNCDNLYLPKFAIKIRKMIESRSFSINSSIDIQITCSIGFVSFPVSDIAPVVFSFEECIVLADRALYCAKSNGRNTAFRLRINEDSLGTFNVKGLIENLDKAVSLKFVTMEEVKEVHS